MNYLLVLETISKRLTLKKIPRKEVKVQYPIFVNFMKDVFTKIKPFTVNLGVSYSKVCRKAYS